LRLNFKYFLNPTLLLQFDDFGYITPYEVHNLTLEDFERIFVIDSARERLFGRLLDLVSDVKGLGATEFYLWVDGSFVTKKRVPRDIDVVVFFRESDIENMIDFLVPILSNYENDLDIFFTTEQDEWSWKEFFNTDRGYRLKGFVQLKFAVSP